ncbi:hypothetical protein JCM8547_008331 [Rhodosporidiobolus lusitaniae]
MNTGATIPAVALGTWRSEKGQVASAVEHALKVGYPALIYENEKEVGQGIKASGVPQSEIFLTSKLWNTFHDDVESSLEESLNSLGVDYRDLLLVHWPVRLVSNESSRLFPVNANGTRAVDRQWTMSKTWAAMERVYRSGKVKAIGVCNWSIPYLEKLERTWTIVPAVNQAELHPYNPPLGSADSTLLSDPEIVAIAAKHNVSPATVLTSYQPARGVVVLPKSVSKSHIESNLQLVHLDDKDMETLNTLAAKGKQQRFVTPLFGSDLGFDDWYSEQAAAKLASKGYSKKR